jgi:glycerophosphoryl diester phosphodiesterase
MAIVVAHRGVPRLAPENTLRSLCMAQERGADAVEFDVRATKDGHAVLLHDPTLARFWGDSRSIEDVLLDEMKRLSIAADGQIDHIPTFEEVIEKTSLTLIIDCKSTRIVAQVAEALDRAGQSARAKFIGEPEILVTVRDLLPQAEIILSWSKEGPPPQTLLSQLRPSALNVEWTENNDRRFETMARLGYPLWVYTIDDPPEALRAVRLGAVAVITNDLEGVGNAVRSKP